MGVSLDRLTMVGLERILALWCRAVVDRLTAVHTGRVDCSTACEELALDRAAAVTVAKVAHRSKGSDGRVDDRLGLGDYGDIGDDVVERLGGGGQ
jgi:hypothetical protein